MIFNKLLPDTRLVQRARGGDKGAFAQLYRRHGAVVFHLLRRLSASTEIAEDLTQETFIAAYTTLYAWRGNGAFSSWLCGIAIRRYLSVRRSNFQAPATEFFEEDTSTVFVANDDPFSHFKRREAEDALAEAVDSLSESCREVFVLVRMESMAYQDVADLLGIPIGTVRSRLNRATKFLHERLAPLIYGVESSGAHCRKANTNVIR